VARTHKIAVLPGDGIGPEVTREAVATLKLASEIHGFGLELRDFPFGAEHYLRTKEAFPPSALDELKDFDAILLGAIGDPRIPVGMLERAIISGIRFGLDLYVNLRPIKLHAEAMCPLKDKRPDDVDMIVVRENTEDVYAGIGGFLKKGTPDEVAVQEMIFTRKGVERVTRYAFDLCRKRNRRKKLTMVDKANAVGAMDLWTRVFAEVGAAYPDIERDHAYIDAACMWMVKNPESFDTVVVSNMFGDILTDLGAAIQEEWASRRRATSTRARSRCSSPSTARPPSTPAGTWRRRSERFSRVKCCSTTWASRMRRSWSARPWKDCSRAGRSAPPGRTTASPRPGREISCARG